MKVYTVSELLLEVRKLVEDAYPMVWVEGEVIDLYAASSGHLYFSLKDEHAMVSAIVYKERRDLNTALLKNGMKVKVFGTLTVYAKRGDVTIDVQRVYPSGLGDLWIKFEATKRKLHSMGYFAREHKKAIPRFPERIGVVTAMYGAAFHDILRVIRRRAPWVEVIVRSVKVQGEAAADSIAEGIYEMNDYGEVDLIIVGRGGGSMEELWAFNEERVAEAIFKSSIPIITGIGHELDNTIADMVADCSAPTPSVAAERATPDRKELLKHMGNLDQRMDTVVSRMLENYRERIKTWEKSYGLTRLCDYINEKVRQLGVVERRMEEQLLHHIDKIGWEVSHLADRLEHNVATVLKSRVEKLDHLYTQLTNLNPFATLERGYSIVFRPDKKKVITSVDEITRGDQLYIKLANGGAYVEVLNTDKGG